MYKVIKQDYIEKVEESSEIYQKEVNKMVAKAEWGADWQKKINQDVVDNLGRTTKNAVGILDGLIDVYTRLYDEQEKVKDQSVEDIIKDNNLDSSDISDIANDKDSGLTYDKNINYQGLINDLKKRKYQQMANTGTYDKDIDKQIENLESLREAKIKDENLDENGYSKNSKDKYIGVGSSGNYTISSSDGKNFIDNAGIGSKMMGRDNSIWEKNSDGTTTIKKGNNVYTVPATNTQNNTSKSYIATGSNGNYKIGSEKGMNFVDNHPVGSTMTGEDSSFWTKNKDGSVTIKKGNNTYTIKSYYSGGVNDTTGLSMLHGEKQKSEVIFNAEDAKKLWKYIHNLNDSERFGNISNTTMSLIKNITTSKNSNDTNIRIEHLELPDVKDNDSFIKQLRLISLNS